MKPISLSQICKDLNIDDLENPDLTNNIQFQKAMIDKRINEIKPRLRKIQCQLADLKYRNSERGKMVRRNRSKIYEKKIHHISNFWRWVEDEQKRS